MSNKSILPDPNDKEEITVAVFDDLEALMHSGNMIQTEKGLYHYLPYWFKKVGGLYFVYHLSALPSDLKRQIEKDRQFQPDHKEDWKEQNPVRPEDAIKRP